MSDNQYGHDSDTPPPLGQLTSDQTKLTEFNVVKGEVPKALEDVLEVEYWTPQEDAR